MSVEIVDEPDNDKHPSPEEFEQYMKHLYSKYETPKANAAHPPERNMFLRHPWHGVGIGPEAPEVVNAIIEIPALSRVKTELDKPTGLMKVDRILHSSVVYPANYGFIPETYADDKDPLDILILCQLSVPHGCLMRVRPIGVMPMVDSGDSDDKIIAVSLTDPEYNIYHDVSELPPFKLLMINQFFNDYKTLERKEVKTFKPLGAAKAKRIIDECFEHYHHHFHV